MCGAVTGFGTQGSQVQILPLRPDIIRFFLLISIFGQVGHRFSHRNTLLADGRCRPVKMIGGDGGGRRCPAGRLATGPGTRQLPRSARRVASTKSQRCGVRCHLARQPGETHSRFEAPFHRHNRLPLNSTSRWRSARGRSSDAGEQAAAAVSSPCVISKTPASQSSLCGANGWSRLSRIVLGEHERPGAPQGAASLRTLTGSSSGSVNAS
jgi:hypothetical protein